ncbi:hypothetical protein [Ruegeria jejuensis]|uniref:hypothetical protein n=1 Tax=Ruegeria jejuensis TaxID=3233338 RepID=UPI00355BE13B
MSETPTYLCDVCQEKEALGAACSALGPVSFQYCGECAFDRREPEAMFEATLDLVGEDVALHVKVAKTIVDGKVLTWDEWLAARGDA